MCRPLFPLLIALVASAALAAPVPPPRPPPRPWFTGWERPVDPVGDTHFERDGARLSITIKRALPAQSAVVASGAPQLMREADGDFELRVRVRAEAPEGARC